MPIPRWTIAVLVCFPAMTIHGQQRQVAGPVAGYVFDGSALRPIAGVPGGATLGEALDLGFTAHDAMVSPRLDSAIVTASDGSLRLFRLSGHSAAEVSWNGVSRGPAWVVFSPSGTAAAIYAAGRVQIVSGLPNSPLLAFTTQLGPLPVMHMRQLTTAAPAAMAVSDNATWLLVASEGRVRALSSSGASSVLMEGTRGVSLAFEPGSRAAAVLNGAAKSFEVFTDFSAAPSQRIAAPDLAEPVGLAFSADGRAAVAATRTGNAVTLFALASGTASSLDCSCVPTGVARLGNMFRLTDAGSGPVWLVDLGVSTAHIVFVPARANP